MKRNSSFLEWIFIHCFDFPEYVIKDLRGKSEPLKEIYENHEKKYEAMLKKARKYLGDFPKALEEKIFESKAPCNILRYHVACTRVKVEGS